MSNVIVQNRPEASPRVSLGSRLTHVLSLPAVGPLLALLIASAFFTWRTDKFLTGHNLSLIVQQVVVVGTLALGQTLIILTAGIDLANGLVMALGSVVMTSFAVNNGMNPVLAIGCGLLLTTAFGLLNGALITLVRLPPFIVTLGTLNIAFAVTRIYTTTTITDLPPSITALGNTFAVGKTAITYGSVLMLLLFFCDLVCVARDRLGATRLLCRQQPRGNPVGGHLDHALVDQCLHSGGSHLWHCWFAAGRPHRRG